LKLSGGCPRTFFCGVCCRGSLRAADHACDCSHVTKGSCCPRSSWCGRRESNPHEPFKLCGFSYRLRLSPPGFVRSFHIRFAVWTIPSPSPGGPGLRRCPSSLYTFPADFSPGLARDCHMNEVSPILSSSASPVSRRALKLFLKSAASAIPPRPRSCFTAL
jgi:hypothetical protein